MSEVKESPSTLKDYLLIFQRRKWIILLSFLVVTGFSIFFSFITTPVYQSKTTLMIEEPGGMKEQIFEVPSLIQKETRIKNQVEIIKSRTLGERVIQAVAISPHEKLWVSKKNGKANSNLFESVERLHRNMEVVPIRETDIIEIRVTASHPDLCAFLANTIAEEYYKESLRMSRGEITEVRQFLEGQLQNIQQELQANEEALKDFKEKEKIAALPEETEERVKQLVEFETIYNEALTELTSYQKRLEFMKSQLSERKSHLVEDISQISSPLIQQLRAQMANLEGLRAEYIAQGVAENHPKMEEIVKRIGDIKKKLIAETSKLVSTELVPSDPLTYSKDLVDKILSIEIEMQSLWAKTSALGKIVDKYSGELNSLPEKSLQLARLERTTKVGENIFLMLKEKYEEAKIKEAGQIGNVRIIDGALPPEFPIKPKKKMNVALGGLLGIILGIGTALLWERLDTSIRTIEEIEALGLPVLGSIPIIKSQEEKVEGRKLVVKGELAEIRKIASNLITHFEPKSPISEAYRTIRTNIQFSKLDTPLKTILVTSSGPHEGKSTTVANLAISMAQMGTKTLILDSDLRRPVLHSIFGLEKEVGLTHYLVGKVGLKDVIKPTPIENLSLITCGVLPPNPSELLGSFKMKEFVQALKEDYEVILFDSPPVIAVTDACVLSTFLDGVLLVVASGQISGEAVQRASSLLSNVGAKLIGAILNKVNVESTYGSYHYYYYYHYYYDEGRKRVKEKRKKEKGKKEENLRTEIVSSEKR